MGDKAPRSRPRRRLPALAVLGVLAVLAVQPPFALDVVARVASAVVWKVETTRPVAAITFDDGPDPVYTPQVLDALARHQAKATFFLVGRRARQRPDLVARIRAEGHEVANHTETHGRTLLQPRSRFEEELLEGEKTLGLENARPKLFRPPGIWLRPSQQAAAARHGYLTVLGSSYAFDPYRPPTRYIEWVIARNLRPGTIVVLHDSGGDRSRTVAALPAILRAAREKDLELVTLKDLIGTGRAVGASAGPAP
ncbi:MAG TPA: polysaccharide deacetylase family protein [Vicinamibacteria bacterium]|nr:polysaccharide deacetylase family protein [Vicinamibacteria bacterium]